MKLYIANLILKLTLFVNKPLCDTLVPIFLTMPKSTFHRDFLQNENLPSHNEKFKIPDFYFPRMVIHFPRVIPSLANSIF